MAADALVSVGVLVSGVDFRGPMDVVDPIVGLSLPGVIASVWSRPATACVCARRRSRGYPHEAEMEKKMEAVPGVRAVHHIHIWAISTTENALTAHVVLDSLPGWKTVKRP